MKSRRVAVTGLGLVSPSGGDLNVFFDRLLNGKSAVRHMETEAVPRPPSMPAVCCDGFGTGRRLDAACRGVDHVLTSRRGVAPAAAISNAFAFGGSNAVLAFRAAPDSLKFSATQP